MKDKLLKNTQHEYSPGQRLVLLFFAGILFLILVPAALVSASSSLEQALHLPKLAYKPVNGLLGLLSAVAGLSFGLWSNYVQFTIGRGTPVPIMATQRAKISKLTKVLGSVPEHVTFVPIGFNEETLQKLFDFGYSPQAKTLFIWEGVVHYITVEAVDQTLNLC